MRSGDVERKGWQIDYGNPAWSPDGKEIALVRCNDTADDACAIFVVPANGEGGRPRRVTEEGLYGQPVWSPDGRRLAYEAGPLIDGIVVVAADGSGVLWSTSGADFDPNWSPDGQRIAFVRSTDLPRKDVRHDVYVIAADGTGARRITDGRTSAESPAWSPTGDQIVFMQWAEHDAFECDSSALFAAAPDGSKPRRLTPYRQFNGAPTWSPDGRQIAFLSIEECWSDEWILWLVAAENGNVRPISPTVRVWGDFAWRPSP